jgi:type IV secretory pathway TraG/TraD family ATPase VirD4
LAPFANIERIMVLRDRVKSELENAVKLKTSADKGRIKSYISDETIKIGQEALREIEKVATRDRVYFSKVSSTYATTMTKLSSGDVGRMLCDIKINPLRDRLYTIDKGALVIMQPYPLKYDSVANTVVKIFMSMFSSIIGEAGETGVMTKRRMHVMIDEAGAVVTRQVAENLANKGGGLNLSLHLYSQSMADYIKRLEKEGAAILADNCNTKGFFRVNHNDSSEEMSAMIGTKKMGAATYTSSDNREGRAQSRTAEEAIVPPHLLQQLDPLTWVLKTDNAVYMMSSPWQEDSFLRFSMPKESQYKRVAQINHEMGLAKNTL